MAEKLSEIAILNRERRAVSSRFRNGGSEAEWMMASVVTWRLRNFPSCGRFVQENPYRVSTYCEILFSSEIITY